MRNNFNDALAHLLKEEGGYVDDPRDPGGATNHGVTLATFRQFLHRPDASKDELKNIDPKVVETIYYLNYWSACQCNDLPNGLDAMVFDFAVNAGPKRAIILLQRMFALPETGIMQPIFDDEVKKLLGDSLINPEQAIKNVQSIIKDYSEVKRNYYKSLKNFPIYGKGWLARVDRVEAFCLNLCSNNQS